MRSSGGSGPPESPQARTVTRKATAESTPDVHEILPGTVRCGHVFPVGAIESLDKKDFTLPAQLGSVRLDWILLALRIAVAGIFLWHGVPKAFDPSSAAAKFVDFGLPGWLGPVIGWIEVVGAPLVLTGFAMRAAAVVLGVVILGALATVQIPGGITAGLERDLLLLLTLALLLATGPGRLAMANAESGA